MKKLSAFTSHTVSGDEKQEVMVTELCEARDSIIHGRGVFARAAIPEEARIIEYVGEKITKAESNRRGLAQQERAEKTGEAAVYIFDLNKRHDLDGNVPWNLARLINHSCEPNCEAQNIRGHIWVIALRDIDAGEELTFNYGYDIEHFLEHPCRCGTRNCVGYIVREDQWRKLKRILARSRGSKRSAQLIADAEAQAIANEELAEAQKTKADDKSFTKVS